LKAELAVSKLEKTTALAISEDHDARFRRLDASIEALISASTTTTAAAAEAAEAANAAKSTAKLARETAEEGMKTLLETLRVEDEARMRAVMAEMKPGVPVASVAPVPAPEKADENAEEPFSREDGEKLYQSVIAGMLGGVLRLVVTYSNTLLCG
jgi:type IV secretory pathway VirB10-like protein